MHIVLSLLPVVLFLAALYWLDSYKLLRITFVAGCLFLGALTAICCYFLNTALQDALDITLRDYSRYAAPLVEELVKSLPLVFFLARRRFGFMVDAAIAGFALGAGFAFVENIYYLMLFPSESSVLVWLVRGFGTAIMHGGVVLAVSVTAVALTRRADRFRLLFVLPGLVGAVLIHAAFNQFILSPLQSSVAILLLFPPIVMVVYRRSEASLERWLALNFDSEARLLAMITRGEFSQTSAGAYLQSLKIYFPSEVVFDMYWLLRLHLELALKVKGRLLMKQAGFTPAPDPTLDARFKELSYLESQIGPTAMLALQPVLRMSRKELWQVRQLQKEKSSGFQAADSAAGE